MTIKEIHALVPPPAFRLANCGYSLAWHYNRIYAGAPNCMDGDRPSGRVFVWELEPVKLYGAFGNPHQTGRPNVAGWSMFTYSDRWGHALAVCNVGESSGIIVSAPRWDGMNPYVFGNDIGMIHIMHDNGELGLRPDFPLPLKARLGESLDAKGSIVVAGAPGAQMAIVYDLAAKTIHVLRPDGDERGFGYRVSLSSAGVHVHSPAANNFFVPEGGGSYILARRDDPDSFIYPTPGQVYMAGYMRGPRIIRVSRFVGDAIDFADVPFPTEMPFVPIVWISDNRFAAGDVLMNNGIGGVRVYEVTE